MIRVTLPHRVPPRRRPFALGRLPAALLCLAALAACSDEPPPEPRPSDLAVRYQWDLAPADVKGRLMVADKKARYREQRGKSVVRFTFSPSPEQLDRLWTVLREQRIDTLESDQGETPSRSVETLKVAWGERSFEVKDGDAMRVEPEQRERWRRIQVALRDLILAERRKRGLPEN